MSFVKTILCTLHIRFIMNMQHPRQIVCSGLGLVLLLALLAGPAAAQHASSRSDTAKKQKVYIDTAPKHGKAKKPKAPSTEFSVGGGLNTNGWGVSAIKGWVKSDDEKNSDRFYNVRFVQVEFVEHKHAKEVRGTNNMIAHTANERPRPFIYAKVNNFYALRLSYGMRKMIGGKLDQSNVALHWVYAGGLSLGLLKPYYIDAYVLRDKPIRYERESIRYNEENRDGFIKQQNIVGSSGWTKGLGETSVVPGIHAKTGLHFDFAKSTRTKMAIEVGVAAELYTRKIELMATQDAYPYLVNGYVALQFGRRK